MASTQSAAPAIITAGGAVGRPSRYEAPFRHNGTQAQKDRILGWLYEAVNEGEHFLKEQSGYQFVDTSHRIMMDKGFDELPPTLSKVSDNFVNRDLEEMVGTLSNPRPLASFKCENPEYDGQSLLLNNGYLHWYNSQFVDRSIRKALYYAAVEGTGYLIMEWDPGYWGTGRGDIRLQPLGVDSVLPIQMPAESWDLQEAYAVIIRRQFPITYLAKRFPLQRDLLVPDGESISKWRRLAHNLMDRVVPTVHNTYGSQRGYRTEDPGGRWLVTVYDVYILDYSINASQAQQKLGQGAWEYQVPFYGQPLPTGLNYPDGRGPITKPADSHDSRLFPYRRHLVATRNAILYDDTSRWWHGQVPVTKFTLKEWPFEYAGIPLTKQPAKLQSAVTSLLRAYDDAANAKLRPNMTYDTSRVNSELANSIDLRQGGQVVGLQNMFSEAFKMLADPGYYEMGDDVLEVIQYMKESATRLMGLHDIQALEKAAQMPSGDTLEKAQEMAGALITDMSRQMEASLKSMAEQFKGLFFEFYDAKRRFHLFGPDGLTTQDFDFDPAQLTPSNLDLPGLGLSGSRFERGRVHMQNFHFSIVPNSVYAMTQSTRRLLLLQLARMGMPISPYTLLEQFDVPSPGRAPSLPDGKQPSTEIERWKAWQYEQGETMIEIQMKLQKRQMELMAEMDPLGQLAGAIGQLGQMSPAIAGAVGSPVASGNPQGAGRPPTAQVPPHVETKEEGTRSTIAES